ncbi:hypothetical protein [Paracoccus litorisediminis]|uniref:Uncharacterized protein n=1 Tax=Paracoccus litorisediminis TaxID=2006130 RepID=A0A844HLK2_9RHOB|nr:hypothetical protein [Paracoccus litorisediminis]MTH61153.1 hypothetical protein [Paracoccus litorisediminis]
MSSFLTWILIMTIDTGYAGVPITAEFNTVEACQEAAKVSKQEWRHLRERHGSRAQAVCAYKGDEE